MESPQALARPRGREEPPEWKKRIVAELAEKFRKYPVVGIADLTGMPTRQLQQLRKKFRKVAEFRVAKKRLILKAAEAAGLDAKALEEILRGTVLLIFTDMNPFKMARMIESEKIPVAAKPGDVAEKEIVVPEGDTGIQPGPMLSVFGKLRIPYEIRKGTVYVKKDTVVAKPGDVISQELASLLQQLGIMPFEAGIKLQAALDHGLIIPRESLIIDVEKMAEDVGTSTREAILLAAEIAFPIPEAIEFAIARAERELIAVSSEASVPLPGLIDTLISRAEQEASTLVIALGDKAKELGIEAPAPAAPAAEESKEEAKKEEKEEESKEEEVDIGEGLSGLFGM